VSGGWRFGFGSVTYVPRELSDRSNDGDSRAGFLYYSSENRLAIGHEARAVKLPEDWIEDTNQGPRVKSGRRKNLPRPIMAGTDGKETWAATRPFRGESIRFCLHCRVAYDFRTPPISGS